MLLNNTMKHETLNKLVSNLTTSFNELSNYLIDNSPEHEHEMVSINYPFHLSFEEINIEVMKWKKTISLISEETN